MNGTLLVTICCSIGLTLSCGSQPPATFTEKKLVLAGKKTAEIKEIGLSITNNGCGRQWVTDGDKPGSERPYCDLLIRYKDSTVHAGHDFKPVYIGNLKIQVQRINPWGREEDSIPPGGCRILVQQLPPSSR